MQPIRPKLEIIVADITTLDVDAIVNAANPQLLAGGGVCGAIHAAAGPELERECLRLYPEGIQPGQVVATEGFNAKAKRIIHAVAPRADASGSGDLNTLVSAYESSVRVADQLGIRKIAFPSLGTGIYGWKIDVVAEAVLGMLSQAAEVYGLDRVAFCCFTEEDADAYWDVVGNLGLRWSKNYQSARDRWTFGSI